MYELVFFLKVIFHRKIKSSFFIYTLNLRILAKLFSINSIKKLMYYKK